jgi:hypothetical protein
MPESRQCIECIHPPSQAVHPWLTPCSARRVQRRAHSVSMGVMSPSINAASIPVQWCTANHVDTYVYVHGNLSLACLLQAGVQGRLHRRPIWRQPQQQHGVLIECRSKPSCCVAAGSRRVRYIIRCTFGQVEVTQSSCCCYWPALHSQTLRCLLACIPAAVTCFCIPYVLHCCFLILQLPYIVSLAASTGRLNRCPRAQAKSAFPNASGRINLEN